MNEKNFIYGSEICFLFHWFSFFFLVFSVEVNMLFIRAEKKNYWRECFLCVLCFFLFSILIVHWIWIHETLNSSLFLHQYFFWFSYFLSEGPGKVGLSSWCFFFFMPKIGLELAFVLFHWNLRLPYSGVLSPKLTVALKTVVFFFLCGA